jgi:hypothetical protein
MKKLKIGKIIVGEHVQQKVDEIAEGNERHRYPATTNLVGAGKWRDEFNEILRDADIVILPDNDPQSMTPTGDGRDHADGRPMLPGQDHGQDVARRLYGIAPRVRVLDLAASWPTRATKDVSDCLARGGTVDKLRALVEALPDWKQTAPKHLGGSNSRRWNRHLSLGLARCV